MIKTAVLIDERDRRIGKLHVPQSCFVIQHDGATFVRTEKTIRLHHSHRAFAVVFDQCEVYVRERLETI
jgi:hypothetical protein